MTDVNYNALKNHIMNVTGRSELDIMDDMYIKLYVSGTVGISCDWILGKFSVTRDKLAEVYKYSLPEPLKKYFYA